MTPKLEVLHKMNELFTTKNHFAEATEEFVCEQFELEPAPANTEGYDAIKRKGSKIIRIQIKGRSLNKKGETSPLDGVKPDGFDLMIALIVDDFKPVGFLHLPAEFFYENARLRKDGSKPGYALTVNKAILREYLREKPEAI